MDLRELPTSEVSNFVSKKKRLGITENWNSEGTLALPYSPARIGGRVVAKEFGLEEMRRVSRFWQRCNDASDALLYLLKKRDGAEPNTGYR